MASRKRNNKPMPFEREDSGNEESPSPQKKKQSGSLFIEAEKMLANDTKRRGTQRKAVVKDHEERVKTTTAKINTLYADRKTRVNKSQRVHWQRLNDLNKRRQDLEGQILQTMKNLEQHTANASKQINAILDARTADIQETASAGRTK